MERIESVSQMQAAAAKLRHAQKRIVLVPTQGALHDGHRSLIEGARKLGDAVVVSVFVNPVQYGANEDPTNYPRHPEGDVKMCEELGVTALFSPSQDEIYPPGYSTFVTEEKLSEGLCGISRPAYFRGVATVLTKLCNIVGPEVIVFGQKNAQQAAVARKLVHDLNFHVQIEVLPTVREPGGLPWGSRNRRLSPVQREDAKVIHEALMAAQHLVESGVRNVDRVVAEATHTLSQSRRVRIIYASVVEPTTMEPERQIVPGRSLLAIAVWVDEVRLIDNITL